MAEDNSLTEAEYRALVDQLEAQANEFGVIGDTGKAAEFRKAAQAVRAWLDEEANRPEAVLARYGYLIGFKTADPGVPPDDSSQELNQLLDEGESDFLETATGRDFFQAELYLERGLAGNAEALRQAAALSKSLQEQPEATAQVRELYARAQNELNRRLEEALEAGNRAREREDLDVARAHYETALALDPDNRQARNALFDVDETAAVELGEREIAGLRRGLKERRDLRILGDAVYKAEFLDAENKLTPELVGLLAEARQAYDQTRLLQGDETTMMRFGDLAARQAARDRIEDRVSLNEPFIFDVTINKMRPSFEVLEEANKLYRERSQDTAQHEINRINQALPAYPRGALKRLGEALKQPFQEEHIQRLKEKEAEIDVLIKAEKEAELLLSQAESNEDPVTKLRLALQAFHVFPHLAGLEERLRQLRQWAEEDLARRMRVFINHARNLAERQDFEKAHHQIAEAEAVVATWPEGEKPGELKALLQEGEKVRQETNNAAQLHHEFERQKTEIRRQVADPALREAGMTLLEQLGQDDRFKDLNVYKILRNEMDQYRDIGGKLSEARLARARSDWERVYNLSEDILGSGKVGQFKEEVEELHLLSGRELRITEAQKLLSDFDFSAADKLLSQLLRDSLQEKKALQERLQRELAQIEEARKSNKTMRRLLQSARQMAAEPDEKRQVEALEIFRFIAGEQVEKGDDSWPDFAFSFHTTVARKEAAELRKKIRDTLVPELIERFTQLSEEKADIKLSVNKNRLALAAERAELLRDARLLDNEEERDAARWFILRQGRRDAEAKQAVGDWEEALNIWRDLDQRYPGFVVNELRQSRIQLTLYQADHLARAGKSDEGMKLLEETLSEPGLTQSWELLLKLAELHAGRGAFKEALETAARAGQLGEKQAKIEAEKSRKWLLRERDIYETLKRAHWEEENGDPKEAIRILHAGLKSEHVEGSEQLTREREQLFEKMQTKLLRQAATKQRSGSVEDKVEAVVALVDLRELEDLVGIPASERRSDQELKPLQSELQPGAEKVIEDARDKFHPEHQPLGEGIRQAGEIVNRLQTFSRVLPLIGEDDRRLQVDLVEAQKELGQMLDRLKELQIILAEANEAERWRDALLTDNFTTLEQYRQRIRRLGLLSLADVQEFERKLDEWQAIHGYLLGAIQALRKAFVQDEDFAVALSKLQDLKIRPDLRPDSNGRWQQIQQEDYEGIRQLVQHKLRIQDSYLGAIVGWDAVDKAAFDRQRQLEVWQGWDVDCGRLIDRCWTAKTIAEGNSENAPRTKVRADWQAVIDSAQEALALLEASPRLDEEAEEAHSRRARAIQDEGYRREELVRKWLLDAYANQPDYKQFPSPQEFSNAARSVLLLESVIRNAEAIGPENEEEQRRLNHYKEVLEKLKKKPSAPFWKRLLDR